MADGEIEEDANPLAAVMRLNEEIEATLDDPDAVGTPEQFISALRNLAEELSSNAERVTAADFAVEYTDPAGDDEEILSATDIF